MMASVSGANVPTLAEVYGGNFQGNITFEEVCVWTKDCPRAQVLPKPMITQKEVGSLSFKDLPLVEFNEHGTRLKSVVEITLGHTDDIDFDALKEALQSNTYNNLPSFLKFARAPRTPYTLEVTIVPNANGGHDIRSDIVF